MAASPKFNWSSSGEDLIYYQNSNNTIQFSPSIKNEDSEDEEIDQGNLIICSFILISFLHQI
jgi:hypothetical protein